MLRPFDRDPPEVGEFVDHGFAAKAAVTAGLHAAERDLRVVGDGCIVDVANSALTPPGNGPRAGDRPPGHRRSRSMLSVICYPHGLIDAIGANDRSYQTQRLLAVDLHLRLDVETNPDASLKAALQRIIAKRRPFSLAVRKRLRYTSSSRITPYRRRHRAPRLPGSELCKPCFGPRI